MPRNFKYHAIVIASIIIGVTVVFYASGKFDPPAPPQVVTETKSLYNISIQQANWGLNCAESIQSTISALQNQMIAAKDEEREAISKKLEALKPLPSSNNALELVKKLCDGRLQCQLQFSPESLPFSSGNNCASKLEILYLCYNFDQLRQTTLKEGDTPLIDCSTANQPQQNSTESSGSEPQN